MPLAADDDVVVQRDADGAERLLHFAGEGNVVTGGRGVAGRVVVGHTNLYHFPATLICAQLPPNTLFKNDNLSSMDRSA